MIHFHFDLIFFSTMLTYTCFISFFALLWQTGLGYVPTGPGRLAREGLMVTRARFAAGTSTSLAVDKIENTNQMMSFGSKMALKVPLPTRDEDLACAFLRNKDGIIQATWEKGRFERLGGSTYLLKFASLPIPGVDTISPEIEVDFTYIEEDRTITMKSGNWTLKGKTGTIKDSRFMKTFNIELDGMISLVGASGSPITSEGWVKYRVQGEKPSVFKRAPGFILDKTISFIQGQCHNILVLLK